MTVNFKAENGMAPYFLYKNLKFYIQDERVGNGVYKYTCYVRNLESKILEFDDDKAARIYVQERKGVRYAGQSGDKVLYTGTLLDFVICKNKVTVRETARPLTGDFDNYRDCLIAAKEKAVAYIRQIEPEQISLFT